MSIINKNLVKYAFIDRDGTIVKEVSDERIDSLDKLSFVSGVIEGLKTLIERKYTLVMVTNQYDLGTTLFPYSSFNPPHEYILKTLGDSDIFFSSIYICPHGENSSCNCQKPKTGLLDQEFIETIQKNDSIVIGDRDSDLLFAKNLGLKGYKIDENKGWGDLIPKITT